MERKSAREMARQAVAKMPKVYVKPNELVKIMDDQGKVRVVTWADAIVTYRGENN